MKKRIEPYWGNLSLVQQVGYLLETEILALGFSAGKWIMKRGRLSLALSSLAYIALFVFLSRRIPPELLFVAGFVLGAVLVGLWLIVLFTNHKS